MSTGDAPVVRHKTAVKRVDFSRPVRLALEDGIISADTDVFDYGCGRGDDLARLTARGIPCTGWDPNFRPQAARARSAVVNLGYVVNVIEDPNERVEVLRSAWELTRKVLVVAARTTYEAPSVPGTPYGDGYYTQLHTFQKFYEQHELGAWIDATLGEISVAAGTGVFYVFRDAAAREGHAASRCRRAPSVPRVNRSEALFEQHRAIFDRLLAFVSVHGRPPANDEIDFSRELSENLGSIAHAFAVLRRVTGASALETIRENRTEDLLVYIALSRFQRRPKFTDLPHPLQRDIRAFFGSYARARKLADIVLFSTGERRLLDRAARASQVGKMTPSALYVHASALPLLPPLLRVYEGCARMYVGRVEGANIIKLHRDEPAISYLSYPRFERDPHPSLAWSLHIPLRTPRIERRDYSTYPNPPILHRKEEFVGGDFPQRRKFEALTRAEEEVGLYAEPSRIGSALQWLSLLQEKHLHIEGHRLRRGAP